MLCSVCPMCLVTGAHSAVWRSAQDCPKGQFQGVRLPTSNLIFRSDAAQEGGFSHQNLVAGKVLPVGSDQRSRECSCRCSTGKEPRSARTTWRSVYQRMHCSAFRFHCVLSDNFWKASWNLMHFIHACILQWSMPMEHGLKNPQRSPKLILAITSMPELQANSYTTWLGWVWRASGQWRLIKYWSEWRAAVKSSWRRMEGCVWLTG